MSDETNVLAGEWVQHVKRLPGHVRHIDRRVVELRNLEHTEREDAIRGVMVLLWHALNAADQGMLMDEHAMALAREVIGQ